MSNNINGILAIAFPKPTNKIVNYYEQVLFIENDGLPASLESLAHEVWQTAKSMKVLRHLVKLDADYVYNVINQMTEDKIVDKTFSIDGTESEKIDYSAIYDPSTNKIHHYAGKFERATLTRTLK